MNFHLQNLNPCNTRLNNLNKTKARGYSTITEDKYRTEPEYDYQCRLKYQGHKFPMPQFMLPEDAAHYTKMIRTEVYWREWDHLLCQIEQKIVADTNIFRNGGIELIINDIEMPDKL
jgi:hypothetical protein